MTKQLTHNEKFLQFVEVLIDRGMSKKAVAYDAGLTYSKMINILRGSSSADKEAVDNLLHHHGDILAEKEEPSPASPAIFDLEKRIAELEKENQEMKDLLLKIAGKVL